MLCLLVFFHLRSKLIMFCYNLHASVGRVLKLWRSIAPSYTVQEIALMPTGPVMRSPVPDFCAPGLMRAAMVVQGNAPQDNTHLLYLARTNMGWFTAAVALAEVRTGHKPHARGCPCPCVCACVCVCVCVNVHLNLVQDTRQTRMIVLVCVCARVHECATTCCMMLCKITASCSNWPPKQCHLCSPNIKPLLPHLNAAKFLFVFMCH